MEFINYQKIDFLILCYKEAWELHDERILDIIFTPDIVYEEKPNYSLIGLLQLKEYWNENKRKQTNVIFVVDRYMVEGHTITLEWNCSFKDLKINKRRKLEGSMWWTLEKDKIKMFKEKFIIT